LSAENAVEDPDDVAKMLGARGREVGIGRTEVEFEDGVNSR